MRRAGITTIAAIAIVAATWTAAAAQQPDKPRKAAKQTPDQGVDDVARTPPGQAKKGLGERDVQSVRVTVHPTGALVAELDESFEDAVVVTVNADGSRSYTCVHGLPLAEQHVQEAAPVATVPALEEK